MKPLISNVLLLQMDLIKVLYVSISSEDEIQF